MAKKSIFISYRRDDAAGFSHAIHDRLIEHWPEENIFFDVLGIAPGADFASRIEDAVGKCDILIALIGKRWMGPRDGDHPRIESPDDWVRIEISTAIRRGVKIIPVLLDGASMPEPNALPEDIRSITRVNALEVRSSRLSADVWNLTGNALAAIGGKWPPDEPGSKIYSLLSIMYAIFAGGVATLAMFGSMFISIPLSTVAGELLFVVNAVIMLRLPFLQSIRLLSRQSALRIGAVLHVVAFVVTFVGSDDLDFALVFMFCLMPASLLYLGSYAMTRLSRR